MGTDAVNLKVQVNNLHLSFRQGQEHLQVVDGLSVSAAAGEFVSIVGPSGCGKSTLFNIISGLLTPDVGEVWINGADIQGRTGASAYMQQKDLLLPWRTVLSNVLLGPEIAGASKTASKAEAMRLLDQLGLSEFYRHYPAQLSGGMRQRVALIRTLLLKKDILLLDEPFGALDAMTRSVMQSILLDLWGQLGQTILLITHDPEEALLCSDRIYVLTARPATVKEEIIVALPRPRSITDVGLIQLKRQLLTSLQDEMKHLFT